MSAAILLVEDEPHLARVVSDGLEQRGYAVTLAPDGRKAYNLFRNGSFSLCVVDVMLPQVDGFTLVRQIRATHPDLPVLFLTARSATSDVIAGYESGGNDYLKKPFSLEELFLRVAELLKRSGKAAPGEAAEIRIGQYLFVPHKQSLQLPGQPEIRLSNRETQLLKLLYEHRNALLDRREALMTLWGDDSFFNTRTMDVFITRLRKHLLTDENVQILNVRGLGYKLLC